MRWNCGGVIIGDVSVRYNLLVFPLLVILFFFANYNLASAQNAPVSVQFDNATYFFDHSFRINVTDTSAPTQSIYVTVTSGSGSYNYPLNLIDSVNHIYRTSFINFTNNYPDTNVMKNIPAFSATTAPANQDTITATYTSSGTTVTQNANVIPSDYGSMPTPPSLTGGPTSVDWGFQIKSSSAGNYCDVNNYGGDLDKDGICASWKTPNGLKIPYLVPDSTGAVPNGYYTLPCGPGTLDTVCPDTSMPDIYVQVDWMKGQKPAPQAISDVVNAFANAPIVTCVNGVCKTGIRLHLILTNELPFHFDAITTPQPGSSGTTDFDTIKEAYFGSAAERSNTISSWPWQEALTSKKQVFHYAMFIHSQKGSLGSSGIAEIPGNDIVVSLGKFTGGVGSIDQQEGTLMHEIGHNLGLFHSGNVAPTSTLPDPDNCKPNYLSVMSYSRQFEESFPLNRPLDFSHNVLPGINENSIAEQNGVGLSVPPNLQTVYGVPTSRLFNMAMADNYLGSLVSYYPFDGNPNDQVGTNNGLQQGTPPNPQYASGVYNQAIAFGGSNYLTSTTNNFPTGSSDRTISLWIKPTSIAAGSYIFAYGTQSSSPSQYGEVFGLDFADTQGHLTVVGWGNDFESNTALPVNDWTHVAVTLSNNGLTRTLYINGTVDRVYPSTSQLNTIGNTFYIGGWGSTSTVNAYIDDLKIFSSALSSPQVSTLYNGFPQLLVSYYPFDGNPNDQVGTNNGLQQGTPPNPQYASGVYNQAIAFGGSNYLTSTTNNFPTGSSDRTISLWIKPTSIAAGSYIFAYGTQSSSPSQYGEVFGLDFADTQGHLTVVGWGNDFTSNAKLGVNDWTHVDVTLSNNGLTRTLYINGTVDRVYPSTSQLNTIGNTFYIGGWGSTSTVNAYIDDLRVYSDSLSASQTYSLSNTGLSPLVSYYSFNDNYADQKGVNSITPIGDIKYDRGVFDDAFDFDGSNYLTSTTNNFPTGSSDRTISLWIKPTSIAAGSYIFAYGTQSSSPSQYGEVFGLDFADTQGHLTVVGWGNDFTSNAKLGVNDWTHVDVTLSNNGLTRTLYINGTVDRVYPSTSQLNTIGNTFYMGGWGSTSTAHADIENVQISKYALSNNSPMDANDDGMIDVLPVSSLVAGTSSNYYLSKIGQVGCDGSSANNGIITGFDDWDNLQINSNLQGWSSWSNGIRVTGSGLTINTSPSDPPADPPVVNPNLQFGNYSNATNPHAISSIQTVAPTTSYPSIPTVKPSSPNVVYDYQQPHLSSIYENNRLATWMQQWAWRLPHNRPYYLPNEITIDVLNDFRSTRILSILANIESLPQSSFNFSSSNFTTFSDDMATANDLIQQGNTYGTIQSLLNGKNNLAGLLKDPGVRSSILSQIDKEIESLKIASNANPIFTSTVSQPTLTFNPTSGPIGTTVKATGTNFTPYSHITVTCNSAQIGIVMVNGTGSFHLTFIVPPSSLGSNLVVARDSTSREAIATFLVTSQNVTNVNIVWDKTQYATSDQATITLQSVTSNSNQTSYVLVSSSTDPIGITIPIVETGHNTGIFTAKVTFWQGPSMQGSMLSVSTGDTVTASFQGLSGIAHISLPKLGGPTLSMNSTSQGLNGTTLKLNTTSLGSIKAVP